MWEVKQPERADDDDKPTLTHVQPHKAERYVQLYSFSALCTKDKMSYEYITVRDNFLS